MGGHVVSQAPDTLPLRAVVWTPFNGDEFRGREAGRLCTGQREVQVRSPEPSWA